MSHTAEQAKELWCPMVRSVRWESSRRDASSADPTEVVGGCNSGGKNARSPQGARCIADQCAMWRWETERVWTQGERMAGYQTQPTDRGYCGVAGKPEVV